MILTFRSLLVAVALAMTWSCCPAARAAATGSPAPAADNPAPARPQDLAHEAAYCAAVLQDALAHARRLSVERQAEIAEDLRATEGDLQQLNAYVERQRASLTPELEAQARQSGLKDSQSIAGRVGRCANQCEGTEPEGDCVTACLGHPEEVERVAHCRDLSWLPSQ
jgi:hypothetical protein